MILKITSLLHSSRSPSYLNRSLPAQTLKSLKTGEDVNFVEICMKCRAELADLLNLLLNQSNEGEFASFIAYAIAFPNKFIALLDTYDALK